VFLYKCSKCPVVYCSTKCFKAHNNSKCYDLFCKENVEQYLKAKKVTSLEEKQKAQEILSRDKKEKEKEYTPSDQIAFERFKYFHQDQFTKKVLLILV
jgi:hypothetical protein